MSQLNYKVLNKLQQNICRIFILNYKGIIPTGRGVKKNTKLLHPIKTDISLYGRAAVRSTILLREVVGATPGIGGLIQPSIPSGRAKLRSSLCTGCGCCR